ncbi:SpoIIE family protein phosphatase [Streptomyces sp. NPDC048639]|uniref:ATP-binding SpoIIE family protein phosphatase n=1 Tax=Streptomyces sp. NPDC048639 TaxID=3365581 RepID=UPI00371C616D
MMDHGHRRSLHAGRRQRSPGPPTVAQGPDVALAAVLSPAVDRLRASSAITYVPVEGGRALSAAVVVGGPLSIFTTVERMSVEDERYTAAEAKRTGKQAVLSHPESLNLPSRLDVTMPFSYTVVSTPVRVFGRISAVLTMLWVPPRGPRDIPYEELSYCAGVAVELARELEKIGEQYVAVRGASAPVFLLPENRRTSDRGNYGDSEDSGVSLLYHVYKLASALAEASRLTDVIEAVVNRIMEPVGAQCMAVLTYDAGRPHVVGYAGYPPDTIRPLARVSAGSDDVDQQMLLPEEPLFLEDDSAPSRERLGPFAQDMEASALLPLVSGGQRIGALVLGFADRRHFAAEERSALVTMAGLLAQSLERARLFEAEHALAQGLQQGLLPHKLPHIAELDTAARYFPAAAGGAVGGDWYDVLTLPDRKVGLVVGDVEGHSPTGAAVMGQIRSGVRAYATEGHGPADVLGRTSRLLSELGTDLFATCCCVWIDCAAGTAEVSCAGHPAPVICSPGGQAVTPDIPTGVPLGVTPDIPYRSGEVVIPPGTILALYTDGLVHSHTLDLAAGIRRVRDVLRDDDGQRLEQLADRLTAITGGEARRRDDDVALLLARYDGALPGTQRRVSRMSVQRHDLKAVKDVRRFVNDALLHWGRDGLCRETELLTTELVTNALIHADSDVDVRLREYPDRIRVEVRDSDPRPPMPAPITLTEEADTDSEHGRGLVIVETMASAWGKSPSGRGKSVWFEVSD